MDILSADTLDLIARPAVRGALDRVMDTRQPVTVEGVTVALAARAPRWQVSLLRWLGWL